MKLIKNINIHAIPKQVNNDELIGPRAISLLSEWITDESRTDLLKKSICSSLLGEVSLRSKSQGKGHENDTKKK